MSEHIERLFPSLHGTPYQITSPADENYNCIAWAAGDSTAPWWPADPERAFWPAGVVDEETLDAFRQAFASVGYEICASEEWEPGFEKVALFTDARGVPKHAARQLPSGLWTSKLGALEDIAHSLHDLEGTEYGKVAVTMKRPMSMNA